VSGADEAPLTLTWRNFYRDQVLQDLIQLALENNRDLRIAQAQVEAASSQVDIQNASLFPTFSGTAAATISQENSRTVGITDPSAPIFPRSYGLGLGVSAYEIDLWGRVRSASAAAFQRYMDSALTRESIRISLMSNVAAALLTWVADNQAVAVTEQVLQNWQHTYDLVHATAVMGTGNDLDVAQAESTVDEAKRDLQTYLRQRAQAYNQLQLLVGSKIPDQLETSLKQKTNLTDIMSFPTVPAGLPSELVGRRPDIMGAEASLRAANADIGAARAAFYPRIQLTASDGSASSDITKLFSGGMGAWNIAPSITLPFFDAGRLTAELKGAKARKRQQIAEYEKSVQVAFREVADALAGRGTYLQELEAQDALVRANSRQYELALARFQAGSNDYLDTLVAQRALYAARLGSITTELQRRSNEITLFKALGGGWGGETEKRSWSLGEHLL
jgi:multidrug efflux system outer membrane protein